MPGWISAVYLLCGVYVDTTFPPGLGEASADFWGQCAVYTCDPGLGPGSTQCFQLVNMDRAGGISSLLYPASPPSPTFSPLK